MVALVGVVAELVTVYRSLVDRNPNIVSQHWLNVDLTCGYLSIVVRTKGPPKYAMLLRHPDERLWWFDVISLPEPNGGTARSIAIPLWHLYLPAIVGLVLVERRHQRLPRQSNTCTRCGYDLSGLPTDATCPECGQTRHRNRPFPCTPTRTLLRSRGGRVLAGLAVVLVALDGMTLFGSPVRERGRGASLGFFDVGLAGGAIDFRSCNWLRADTQAWWGPRSPRVWLFNVERINYAGGARTLDVELPLWHLYLPAIAGAIFLERRHARKARTPNTCPHCHYDLTGLPPRGGSRGGCPECGHTPA